jgi:hypothetical protein
MVKKLLYIDDRGELERLNPLFNELSPLLETDTCSLIEEAKKLIRQNVYGLIFMELELLNRDAAEMLEMVRQGNFYGQIVFVGDYKNHAAWGKISDCMDLKVMLKPLSADWLKQKLLGYFQKQIDIGNPGDIITPLLITKILTLHECTVTLKFSIQNKTGYLYLDKGTIVNAKYAGLDSRDAAIALLELTQGEISFQKGKLFTRTTIHDNTELFLADICPQYDDRPKTESGTGQTGNSFLAHVITQLKDYIDDNAATIVQEKVAELGAVNEKFPSALEVDLIEAVSMEIKEKNKSIQFKKKMIAFLKDENRT